MNQNLSEAAMNWDNAKIEIVFSKKVVFSDACSSSIYTAQWVSPAQYLTSVALTMRLASMFRYELAHPDEEVDHEENVESEIDLLGQIFAPGNAFFHAFAVILKERSINCGYPNGTSLSLPRGVYEVNYKGSD